MKESEDGALRIRRIKMADGRYLIFYTFDRSSAESPQEQPDSQTTNKTSSETDRESRV